MAKKESKIGALTSKQNKLLRKAEEYEQEAERASKAIGRTLGAVPYSRADVKNCVSGSTEASMIFSRIANELAKKGDYRNAQKFYEKSSKTLSYVPPQYQTGEIRYDRNVWDKKAAEMKAYRKGRAEGYLHEKSRWHEKIRGLEHSASTVAAVILTTLGLGTGLFFLFSSTGNPNIHLSPGTSPTNWRLWIGLASLVVGLIAGFFLIRKNKN